MFWDKTALLVCLECIIRRMKSHAGEPAKVADSQNQPHFALGGDTRGNPHANDDL